MAPKTAPQVNSTELIVDVPQLMFGEKTGTIVTNIGPT